MPYEKPAHLMDLDALDLTLPCEVPTCSVCGVPVPEGGAWCSAECESEELGRDDDGDTGPYDTIAEMEDDRQ